VHSTQQQQQRRAWCLAGSHRLLAVLLHSRTQQRLLLLQCALAPQRLLHALPPHALLVATSCGASRWRGCAQLQLAQQLQHERALLVAHETRHVWLSLLPTSRHGSGGVRDRHLRVRRQAHAPIQGREEREGGEMGALMMHQMMQQLMRFFVAYRFNACGVTHLRNRGSHALRALFSGQAHAHATRSTNTQST
jgi:hypothetical protein